MEIIIICIIGMFLGLGTLVLVLVGGDEVANELISDETVEFIDGFFNKKTKSISYGVYRNKDTNEVYLIPENDEEA